MLSSNVSFSFFLCKSKLFASLYVVLCVSVDMFAVLPLGLKKALWGGVFI